MKGSRLVAEAYGLRKTYRSGPMRVEALRGVDIGIRSGEMLAVMGPSGSGKTTLLHCLAGLDDFDAGRVLLAGQPLHQINDDLRTALRARHTGFVFQAFNLLPVLSARENVELPLLLAGISGKAARERAIAVLDAVGLADRASHRPNELSGGQKQRVAIARALVHKPDIIWADEPTGNLDSEATAEIMNLFCRLHREQGHTFVIVTHSDAVAGHADRILRMRDGLIVGEKCVSDGPDHRHSRRQVSG